MMDQLERQRQMVIERNRQEKARQTALREQQIAARNAARGK